VTRSPGLGLLNEEVGATPSRPVEASEMISMLRLSWTRRKPSRGGFGARSGEAWPGSGSRLTLVPVVSARVHARAACSGVGN
jgi:hypothetical protein